MAHIILNADDFGRSSSINAAVVQAHRQGVLTSTSLMVCGEAADEAVALARQLPALAVGLHLVLVSGRSALSHRDIPHLVDGRGLFSTNAAQIGLRYYLSRAAQRELQQEMEAQFERFASTGLPLAHVDSHLHMHVHPTIFGLLLPLAERFGARGLRLPRDEFWRSVSYDRHGAITKAGWATAFGLLCCWCRRRLPERRLVVTSRVYGLMQTGRMTESYVLNLLRSLRVPTAELYFHPATEPQFEPLGPNPSDLATLLSSQVRQVIEDRGLQPTTYSALWQE